jgi:hypothetical protein
MVASPKRKAKADLAVRSRHKKTLFLPMDKASADQISLRFRMALELIRQGHADGSAVQCMSQVTLLTRMIADAGHGHVDDAVLSACEKGLTRVIALNTEQGEWAFDAGLLSNLTLVVNEHDRQLREVRLQVLVVASDTLERRIKKASSPSDLFASRHRTISTK